MKCLAKKAALFCLMASLTALSCSSIVDFFEDDPDLYMVRQVTTKTLEALEDLRISQYDKVATVGSTLSESGLTMTITSFTEDEVGYWYTADCRFQAWSGTGEYPFMELTGSLVFTDKSRYDDNAERVLKGSLDVDNAYRGNTIDHIEYDLDIMDWSSATGTVVADGMTFDLKDEFILTGE